MYDVVIIGAGVSGAAVAREVSRYTANVLVLERCEDVCCGTSKANSAIVHAGYDAHTGSLMARLNVRGSQMMEELSKELDFPYRRNGSMVLCMAEEDRPHLQTLLERGVANGVEGLRIIEREEILRREPNVSPDVVAALDVPTGAIVCPFGLNIAMAENAAVNGVTFQFDTTVTGFTAGEEGWTVHTDKGDVTARCVVNAAGVYADRLHNMVSAKKLHITPRRGDYYLLDKAAGEVAHATLFQLPGKFGKGVLVSPTVHGNTIVGPTAIDIEDKDSTATTREGLDQVAQKAAISVPGIPLRQTITSFAGLRAHEDGGEFIIGEVSDAPGFFDCAGIESPGLSSSPAIGEMVAGLLKEKLGLSPRPDFVAKRKGIVNPQTLSFEERQALIRENPAYGRVICRCETVTEGEIVDAITRPLGARSLDGVKRRTRAGMGRCQGGFCGPRVMEIIARETGMDLSEITKCGGHSRMVVGKTKEGAKA